MGNKRPSITRLRRAIAEADRRIRPLVRETYLERSAYLSEVGRANVFVKLENLQQTGSFKARGATNKLLSLSPDEKRRGVIAASTGNHGAAVAYGMSQLGIEGAVFVPENASPTKVAAIERLGAEVRYFGRDGAITEVHARQVAIDEGFTFISPYNDLEVAAGQGTIGEELVRQQAQPVDALFASLGGGGLVSGIAASLKSRSESVRIIAGSPEQSKVMMESVRAGRILDLESGPTLSDGTAGGVEAGAITFNYCRRLVDDYVSVTEKEIGDAMRGFMEAHHMLIEGSAGVAIASYLSRKKDFEGQNVVIVICGGNISLDTLKSIL